MEHWDGKWDTGERTCTGLVNTSSVERYGDVAIITTSKLALCWSVPLRDSSRRITSEHDMKVRKSPWQHLKIPRSPIARRKTCSEDQTQDLMVRLAETQRRLDLKAQKLSYTKDKLWVNLKLILQEWPYLVLEDYSLFV